MSALNREISNKYKSEILSTLYFGGGTPSLLTVEEFAGIIKKFAINSKTEITVEVNPETVTYDYLLNLKKSGVNRLSIGCQTFNDEILEYIGRKHSSNDVKKVVSYVKEIGYKNISIDLIYGLPYQILGDFEKDLYTAVNLGIQHVSLYGLKIDEGCYFYNHCPKNLPDEDMQAQMYLKAIEILVQNGFNQYEVSNFAKEKFVSNHNLNYWDNNSYYGFGVAAHGYINGVRYSNPIALSDYIKNPLKPCNIKELSEQEKLEEEIFLGFRRIYGINTKEINEKFNIDFDIRYKNILNRYIQSGHITKTNYGYKLTTEGILLSNYILADFIEI